VILPIIKYRKIIKFFLKDELDYFGYWMELNNIP